MEKTVLSSCFHIKDTDEGGKEAQNCEVFQQTVQRRLVHDFQDFQDSRPQFQPLGIDHKVSIKNELACSFTQVEVGAMGYNQQLNDHNGFHAVNKNLRISYLASQPI